MVVTINVGLDISVKVNPFDPDVINRIKQVFGRSYDPMFKTWHVPLQSWNELVKIPRLAPYSAQLEELYKKYINSIRTGYTKEITVKNYDMLYEFQKEGVRTLLSLKNAMLCDELGLGKTNMAITASKQLLEDKLIDSVLIVSPKSLVTHWVNELQRWIEETDVNVIKGDTATRQAKWIDIKNHNFSITNYEILLKDYKIITPHIQEAFDKNKEGQTVQYKPINNGITNNSLIILDEATRIKNWHAKTTKIIRSLPYKYIYAISGLPIENSPNELFTIVSVLRNNIIGHNYNAFCERYVRSIDPPILKNVDDLKERLSSIMIRRLKKDVASFLPPLTINPYYIELSDKEHEDYINIVDKLSTAIQIYIDKKTVITQQNILSLMSILRMYCDHPALVQLSDSETAMQIKYELKATKSSKFDELKNILNDIPQDKQIVIFTEFEKMANYIVRNIDSSCEFSGKNSADERDIIISDFLDNKYRILVSTDAGGYGLNLANSTYVINYDIPYNPAKLQQRIMRVHRLTSIEPVTAINMIVSDEEKIEQHVKGILRNKQDMAEKIIGELGIEKV